MHLSLLLLLLLLLSVERTQSTAPEPTTSKNNDDTCDGGGRCAATLPPAGTAEGGFVTVRVPAGAGWSDHSTRGGAAGHDLCTPAGDADAVDCPDPRSAIAYANTVTNDRPVKVMIGAGRWRLHHSLPAVIRSMAILGATEPAAATAAQTANTAPGDDELGAGGNHGGGFDPGAHSIGQGVLYPLATILDGGERCRILDIDARGGDAAVVVILENLLLEGGAAIEGAAPSPSQEDKQEGEQPVGRGGGCCGGAVRSRGQASQLRMTNMAVIANGVCSRKASSVNCLG